MPQIGSSGDYFRVARDPSEIVCSGIPQKPGLAILLKEFGALRRAETSEIKKGNSGFIMGE